MLHKLFIKLLVFTVLTYNISSDIYSKNTNENIDNNKLSKNNKTIKFNNAKPENSNNQSKKHDNNDEEDNKNSEDTDKNNNSKENEDNNDLENDEDDNEENEEDNDTEGDDIKNGNNDSDDTEDDDTEGIDTENDNNEKEDSDDSDENDDTESDDIENEDMEETEDDENYEDDDIEYDDTDENTEEDEDDNEDENEEDNPVDDPFEKFNRKVFEFNDKMNNLLDKVTSKNKDKSKPSPISKGIGNFSHNFFEPPIIINYALQGNVKNASNSIARLMINTFFGFFGVTDVAEKLGFEKKNTDFNNTLKKWGMKPGPYVVLPILGPTSLRGIVGLMFEPSFAAKLPLKNMKPFTKNATYYCIYCCNLLSKRAAYGDMIAQVSAMSKDKYKTFRNITMSSESN